ncbi:site-specific DNA-methyltransferase [Methanoplanus endosymbiosus]|uniref:Site-specific DNA-methyltransferase n=1 Tax=Methanoplanus endosymbiosus TaxID=33865 RepID=A0A9E7PQ56_9EURY|nr:site-specific DNA-methyltransferase [Methanoplanus endosymbiosus]UUX92979.1 site-specific DNA-methyltransferase [Methanoplanus endosymbiosus]
MEYNKTEINNPEKSDYGSTKTEKNKISSSVFNPASENLKRLSAIFPSIIKDGQVDFEALKAELGEFEEVDKERYELTWAGKQQAKKTAAEGVSGRTLKYVPEDSKNPETTENLYIEGDNLEVLKLLQNSYMGKVKMIYIDPPYNTGKDFVYDDNFKESKKEYEKKTGQRDENDNPLVLNPETSGRFHANWLSMMYSRLRIVKNLLSDEGVIFISIDDHEYDNLKIILDEIFGVSSHVATAIWRSTDNSNNDAKQFSCDHNYTLVYSKCSNWQPQKISDLSKRKHFKNPDNDPKGPYFDGNPVNSPNYRKNLIYDLVSPQGDVIKPPKNGWRWAKETLEEKLSSGEIIFKLDGSGIRRRTYLCDMGGLPPSSLWIEFDKTGHNRQAKYELLELIPEDVYDTPKPTKLINYIMNLSNVKNNDIVIDFFSGSATTAHAVMQLNAEDGGNRKYIMVQYPEELDDTEKREKDNKEAIAFCDKLGIPRTISEIGKERIRRAGEKIKEEAGGKGKNADDLDIGFKVFKTADTNVRWIAEENGMDVSQTQLDDSSVSDKDLRDFMPDATDIDVAYEILLRQYDIPLSASMETLTDIGPRTYCFADAVVVCLEEELTPDIIDKIAAIEPMPHKVVFRDSAFGKDIALKVNTMERFDAMMKKHSDRTKQSYTVEYL